MKKIPVILLVVTILSCFLITLVSAQTNISVTIDGKNVAFPDAKPFIDKNGRTLIPVRFVSEALGAKVGWTEKTQEVDISKDNVKIIVKINDKNIIANGQKKAMDTQAIIKEKRTFVPIRYVAEALGSTVTWNKASSTVVIVTNKNGIKDTVYKVNPDIPQELYKYGFRDGQYTDDVFTNKEMVEERGIDRVKHFMDIAKEYIETLYKVDYRNYNKEDYVNKIKMVVSPVGNWTGDDKVKRTVPEYINYWADNVKEKQISITTEFITDPSLVYDTLSVYVRGQMKYKVDSCNDLEWLKKFTRYGDVKIGKWYKCNIEVKLGNTGNRDSDWKHYDFTYMGDYILDGIKEVE